MDTTSIASKISMEMKVDSSRVFGFSNDAFFASNLNGFIRTLDPRRLHEFMNSSRSKGFSSDGSTYFPSLFYTANFDCSLNVNLTYIDSI